MTVTMTKLKPKPKLSEKDAARALNSLKILRGDPPHNVGSNICYGDGYYSASLVREYGMELKELADACGYTEWKVIERAAYKIYIEAIDNP